VSDPGPGDGTRARRKLSARAGAGRTVPAQHRRLVNTTDMDPNGQPALGHRT